MNKNSNILMKNSGKFLLFYKKIIGESLVLLKKFVYALNNKQEAYKFAEKLVETFLVTYKEKKFFIDNKNENSEEAVLVNEFKKFLNNESIFLIEPPDKTIFNLYIFTTVYERVFFENENTDLSEKVLSELDSESKLFFKSINKWTKEFKEKKWAETSDSDINTFEKNDFINKYLKEKIQLNYGLLVNYHWMKYITGWFDDIKIEFPEHKIKYSKKIFPLYKDPLQFDLQKCDLQELKIDEKWGYFDKYLMTYESIVKNDVITFKEKVNFKKINISDQLEQLDFAIKNPYMENIAIIGKFSSGKTSLIKNYLKENNNSKNNENDMKKTIWIDWSSTGEENLKIEDNIAK